MSGKNFGRLMMMRDSAKENGSHQEEPYNSRKGYPMNDRERRYPDTAARTERTERSRMDEQYDDEEYGWPVERGKRAPIRAGGTFWMDRDDPKQGRYDDRREPMDEATAMAWVKSMKYEDSAVVNGQKWTPEQVKPLAEQKGIPTTGEKFWEFYAMMHAMYADYFRVAEKFGVNKPDFYACMAKAFMDDKDAVDNKVKMYKMYVTG